MPTVKFKVEEKYSRTMKQLLLWIESPEVKRDVVNQTIADAIQPYVPMKSGALRRSRIVGTRTISWGRGLPYAHYQYEGVVYAPNIPIIRQGQVIGWYSPRGQKKHPTDRQLGGRGLGGIGQSSGMSGFWKGWYFGYTTPGTMHHWDLIYEWKLKSDTNKEITKQLKQILRERRNK